MHLPFQNQAKPSFRSDVLSLYPWEEGGKYQMIYLQHFLMLFQTFFSPILGNMQKKMKIYVYSFCCNAVIQTLHTINVVLSSNKPQNFQITT